MHIDLGDLVETSRIRPKKRGIVVEQNPTNPVENFAKHLHQIYGKVYYIFTDGVRAGPFMSSELKVIQKITDQQAQALKDEF